jgi:hypothetical protein
MDAEQKKVDAPVADASVPKAETADAPAAPAAEETKAKAVGKQL